MRKIFPMSLFSVSGKQLIFIASGVVVVSLVSLLVFFQQNNINSLDIEIKELGKKIWQASSIDGWLNLKKDILGFEKDKTIIQNGGYTNLVQAIGGLVLGITAWIGYQNFRVGEKNLKISEDKQVSERFSKSIEHLGSHETAIRLGGIYALEQIAIDSAKYHWTIVEILSAFVREKCPLVDVAPPAGNSEKMLLDEQSEQQTSVPTPKKVGVDIQAAMTVLGRRKVKQDPPDKSIDLRNVSLPFIEIQGANLSRAKLPGANLCEANLCEANLCEANLYKAVLYEANLSRANLSRAKLPGAVLWGANLCEANLCEANLSIASLYEANLCEANLCEANLWGADLSRANLYGANLSGTDLSNTRFGDNLGISDDMKKELEGKGAIFEDSPGS
jgi:cell division protein FtsL